MKHNHAQHYAAFGCRTLASSRRCARRYGYDRVLWSIGMKDSLSTGLGIATGLAVYEMVVHGLAGADWYRVIFVGVFSVLAVATFNALKSKTSK